jgi:tRNA(fMet)-specific endonuclease VapC
MLSYMLDTNICIHVMKNYPPDLREKFNNLREFSRMPGVRAESWV